jgi:hypothetical protein
MAARFFVIGAYCFMPHPCGEKTHWIRTDRCVAFVGCRYCKAKAGELCIGRQNAWLSSTHHYRRRDYQLNKERFDPTRQTHTVVVEVEKEES